MTTKVDYWGSGRQCHGRSYTTTQAVVIRRTTAPPEPPGGRFCCPLLCHSAYCASSHKTIWTVYTAGARATSNPDTARRLQMAKAMARKSGRVLKCLLHRMDLLQEPNSLADKGPRASGWTGDVVEDLVALELTLPLLHRSTSALDLVRSKAGLDDHVVPRNRV